jgi:hypothetical protein
MTKKLKKCRCRKAVGPNRRCQKKAVAEVRSRGRWHPICHEHALYFFSLLRFLREARSGGGTKAGGCRA